jgi:hypothetical protein
MSPSQHLPDWANASSSFPRGLSATFAVETSCSYKRPVLINLLPVFILLGMHL